MVSKMTIACICSVLLLSCKDAVKTGVIQMQSRRINMDLNKMYFWNINDDKFIINKDALKLVVYIDTSACSECEIKDLNLWNDYQEQIPVLKDKLNLIFICSISGKKIELLVDILKINSFKYSIFIDTLNVFQKNNPHLPHNPLLHTFLLDENNNVILVGNPLHNKKIGAMYDCVIKEKLGI